MHQYLETTRDKIYFGIIDITKLKNNIKSIKKKVINSKIITFASKASKASKEGNSSIDPDNSKSDISSLMRDLSKESLEISDWDQQSKESNQVLSPPLTNRNQRTTAPS